MDDAATLQRIFEERGLSFVLVQAAQFATQKARDTGIDTPREQAQKRGWQQDAELLENTQRNLRH